VALLDQVQAQRLDEGALAHPGTPLMPSRSALPVCGSSAFSNSSARARWSARSIRAA
jgi:hypothetical protein